MDDVTKKICTKCGQEKTLEEFARAQHGRFGRKAQCKACDAAAFQEKQKLKKKTRKSPARKPEIGTLKEVAKKLTDKIEAARIPAPTTAERLANEHWDYVKGLLTAHLETVEDLFLIEFHYKTAMIHGYKHGQEDRSHENLAKSN